MTLVRYVALATISLTLLPAPVRAQPIFQQLVSPNAVAAGGFGNAVSGVPDVDGDGHGDLLVGASREDPGGIPFSAGWAYVYSGATGALLHELVSPNAEVQGGFGSSVSGVPDVDGDGRGDALVGAEGQGRAYVFSGATGTFLYELASPNQQFNGHFGDRISGVPDVDGDGRGDILVGASGEGPGTSPSGAGRAYVFSGATGALLHALASPNEEGGGSFGFGVSGIPDVDGDGRGDVLIGARAEDPGASPEDDGRAYVFSGATGGLLLVLASPAPGQDCFFTDACSFFGDAVAGVDDIDGDGRGDLLVSAPGEDTSGLQDAGRAYIFSSAQPFGLTADVRNSPVSQGGQLRVRVIFTNLSPAAFIGDLVLDVEGPGGVSVSRTLVSGGTLPSGDTAPPLFKLRVPPSAPPGPYTATITALDGGTTPVAEAALAFEITARGARTDGAEGDALWTVEVLDAAGLGAPPASATTHASEAAMWPNPASNEATAAFVLEAPAIVRLALYDVLGRAIKVVEAGALVAGAHRLPFDVSTLPAGVYVWRLTAGNHSEAGRITVAR